MVGPLELGGSWYLVALHNWTYKPPYKPLKCPNMVISTVISTVTISY